MIDYHKELVSVLSSILPTHYEMTLTSKTKTPCISYMELNNYSDAVGDTQAYSRISYRVKVWGNNIELIQEYALKVDEALLPLGFKRTSSGELYDNNSSMIQKILNYECLALEEIGGIQ
jgi:hypothetical protein